ncbi:phosphopantetheine-binding protein [uncultured Megamonas sp.]|uniref:phosphopantetheine-binding protein n=1 Tax=uncultured Megamonas sp. TaxID=286140 RepID=UPI0025915DFF|nr:phosphopantetheine-binding protein [uncultured Megamonas sp.]
MIIKDLEKIIQDINMFKGVDTKIILEDETKLREDLNLDSLDLATLTAKIEDLYGIDIFENGFVNTIGEILIKLEK